MHQLSIVRACQLVRLSRTAYYRSTSTIADRDARIIDALLALVAEKTRWGFWMCWKRLRALGYAWNHKRVYRVYCALRLNQVRRTKKRVLTRVRVPLDAAAALNDTWAMDFMGDTLYDGRKYRVFNVLDEGNRECLAIEIDTSLPSVRVTHVLDHLITMHGRPRRLRCDNGPEFLANALRDWCDAHGILLQFIQPGKPNQNAYIERFNRSYREEILNAWIFTSLAEVRALSEDWRVMYNTERPHQSLGDAPPSLFLPRNHTPDLSNIKLCA